MPLPKLQTSALTLCAAGVALHLYTAFFKADGGNGVAVFLVGLVLWSCAPYAIAAVLACRRLTPWGLGAAAACLAADVFMHCSVFVAPKGSTAAIGLLVMPFWNLVAFGPAGALVFWLVHRVFRRQRAADAG